MDTTHPWSVACLGLTKADVEQQMIARFVQKHCCAPSLRVTAGRPDLLVSQVSSDYPSLVVLVVDMVLIHPVNYDLVAKKVTSVIPINGGTFGSTLWALERVVPECVLRCIDATSDSRGEAAPTPAKQEPIAIVGMAAHTPGATDTAQLWEVLGTDFVRKFFKISLREARSMDPQQRVLHTTYVALENAGYIPDATPCLRRATFGYYIGVATQDYAENLADNIDIHYFADLCLWSSSIVEIHPACRALMTRDCDAALAGGVSIVTSPNRKTTTSWVLFEASKLIRVAWRRRSRIPTTQANCLETLVENSGIYVLLASALSKPTVLERKLETHANLRVSVLFFTTLFTLHVDNTIIGALPTAWVTETTPRVAVLNNFGATGSNGALILEEYIKPDHPSCTSFFIFGISTKLAEALENLRSRYMQWLGDARNSNVPLGNIAYTATARRQLYPFRLVVTPRDKHWGVVPAGVIRQSLGEYAAIVTAGVLSIETALSIVAKRARLTSRLCAIEKTLSINLSFAQAQEILTADTSFSNATVACVNTESSCVVSGPVEELQTFSTHLTSAFACKTVSLQVPLGFHSSAMDPILEDLRDYVATLPVHPPSIFIASNVYGTVVPVGDSKTFQADYLAKHCS
ncbi:hypothetical protein OG21DRAFT_1525769 [Imleria badia]|nr:hypothetical protein OG21DRAFT_1525769 [Imleria badia]